MDSIIDIIVLILIGVVPAAFKAIGNRLEKAGKTDKADKFKRIAQTWEDKDEGDEDDETEVEDGNIFNIPVPEVTMVPAAPKPMVENVVPQIKAAKRPEAIKPAARKPMMLVEDEPKRKGEKIDPKKLVIYSEIMKRKY